MNQSPKIPIHKKFSKPNGRKLLSETIEAMRGRLCKVLLQHSGEIIAFS